MGSDIERKSSEVLLDLEKKIDLILGYIKTIDLNNKLILNRMAGQVANTDSYKNINQPKTQFFVDKQINQSISKKYDVNFSQFSNEVEPEDSALKQEIQLELQPKGQRRDIRNPIGIDKKIPIQQKVLYPDGKVVILANVEIYDEFKNLLKKTRTNNIGKWSATVDPGKYTIRVQKTGTNEKPAVERSFEIEVPSSEAPIELDILK